MGTCAGCRVRHLNCDARSTCGECEKSGRPCVRLNVRFRNLVCPSEKTTRRDRNKYEFFFGNDQTWVDTEGKIEFAHEIDSLQSEVILQEKSGNAGLDDITEEEGFRTLRGQMQLSANESDPLDEAPPFQSTNLDEDPPDYATTSEQTPYEPPEDNFLASEIRSSNKPNQDVTDDAIELSPDLDTDRLGGPQPALGSVKSLRSLDEGRLLQHFITHIAPWFDVGDSKRHFGKVLPCMAATTPFLMAAMLALAALHQSRVNGNCDLYDAITLHNKCLNQIVPMLSDSDRSNDDALLATTTILHLYDGLETGNDLPRHLKGTSVFFPAEAMDNWSQPRRAIFWVYLRQEIYNAYLYQRNVITDLDYLTFSFDESEDDDMWFHQILYITALVTKWAFGEEASQSRWHELREMTEAWESTRPTRFNPLYSLPRDAEKGRYFPETCYATDEHVAAAHFFYMAKLLLTAHDPGLPRIGPRMKAAAAIMQETALSQVRTLVGIAACNTLVVARFTANLAVNICASWFTDPLEQRALLEFMRDTSRCSGWERRNAQRALIKEWGLDV